MCQTKLCFFTFCVIFTCMGFIYCIPSHELECRELREYKRILPDGTVSCVPCTKCQRGECVLGHCFEDKDTVCRARRQDEYIKGHVCTVCSDCGKWRATLKNCSKHSDAVCSDCIHGYKWDPMVEDCVPEDSEPRSPEASIQSTSETSTPDDIILTTVETNDVFTSFPTAGTIGSIQVVWAAVGGLGTLALVVVATILCKCYHKGRFNDNKACIVCSQEYDKQRLNTNETSTKNLLHDNKDHNVENGLDNVVLTNKCARDPGSAVIYDEETIIDTRTHFADLKS